MSFKSRVRRLEKRANINQGMIYFVLENNDSYKLMKNGADVLEDVEMTQKEYEKWHSSKSENDVLFIVKRREYKDGDFVTKDKI